MNILQAHKYFWRRDGASNYMIDLSRELDKAGHKVIPFTLNQEETFDSDYSEYFVSAYNLSTPDKYSLAKKIEIASKMIYNYEAKRNMDQLLHEVDVDLAHIHNIYHHISPSILPSISKQGASIAMTLHDYKLISPNYTMFHHGKIHREDCEGWYLNCIKNKCMKDSLVQSILVTLEMIIHHKFWRVYENYIDKFIAPSKFMKDICVEYGWEEDKFVHIPNPIDAEEFEFSEESGDYIAFIGRLAEEKGVEVLVEAAAKLPEIPFYITGSGPLSDQLKATVKQKKLDNVHFDGFLSGKDLKQRIRGAELVVLPSIWYENYPISILEAKAMGRIPIASDIGGLPEQLPEELLVEPDNAKALAAGIEKWFTESEQKKKKLRKKLRQEVETENNPQRHLEQILSLYRDLIN